MAKQKNEKNRETASAELFEEVPPWDKRTYEEVLQEILDKNEAKKKFKPKKTEISKIIEDGVISSAILQEKLKISQEKANEIINKLSLLGFIFHLKGKEEYIIKSAEGVKGYFHSSDDDQTELIYQIEALTDRLKGIGHERLFLLSDKIDKELFELKTMLDDEYLEPECSFATWDAYSALAYLLDCGYDVVSKQALLNVFQAYQDFENMNKLPENFVRDLVEIGALREVDENHYKVENKEVFLKNIECVSRYITDARLRENTRDFVDYFATHCLIYDKMFMRKWKGKNFKTPLLSHERKSEYYKEIKRGERPVKSLREMVLERMEDLLNEKSVSDRADELVAALRFEIPHKAKPREEAYKEALELAKDDVDLRNEINLKHEREKNRIASGYERICSHIDKGHISATTLRRVFEIGYPRAARIMDILEEEGFVERTEEVGKWKILSKEKLKEFLKDFDDMTWKRPEHETEEGEISEIRKRQKAYNTICFLIEHDEISAFLLMNVCGYTKAKALGILNKLLDNGLISVMEDCISSEGDPVFKIEDKEALKDFMKFIYEGD